MPTIPTGNIQTHYEEAGEGPALVLVHAATLDLASWKDQVADLATDHRVIAYDMRGHGKSQGCPHRRYTMDLLADDLHAFIKALDLDRPVVCGISMGGMVAQTYASRHPDALRGLVLAGTTTPPILSFKEHLQRVVMPRSMIGPARLVGYGRLKDFLLKTQERVHGKDAMGEFKVQDLPSMPTKEFVKAIKCFASFHKTKVDLEVITVPTLILYGEKEPAFFHAHAARLKELIPHAEVAVIPKAGHASNFDAPKAFNGALRGFLGALARP